MNTLIPNLNGNLNIDDKFKEECQYVDAKREFDDEIIKDSLNENANLEYPSDKLDNVPIVKTEFEFDESRLFCDSKYMNLEVESQNSEPLIDEGFDEFLNTNENEFIRNKIDETTKDNCIDEVKLSTENMKDRKSVV